MAYVSVILPYESNPKLRSIWHPTDPVGPFSELSRGAFKDEAEAQTWVDRNLPLGSAYSFRTYD